MKVHYNNALQPDRNIVFACSIGGESIPATTDPALVTCGNCKRRMGNPPRPAPYPSIAIICFLGGKVVPFARMTS